MTLWGHLAELRSRLITCIIAVVIGAIVGFVCWNWVLDVATDPYCAAQRERGVSEVVGESPCQLYISSPLEMLTTRLTISGFIGLFLASPIVLWQIWRFVTPGLHRSEKRYAVPFVLTSIVLFAFGASVAWLVFPKAIAFFLAVGGEHVMTLFNPGPYLKLIFMMMALFGLVFEIPLLLVFLQLAGVVTSSRLRAWRRQAIVANFVIAAIATPSGDPYSLLAMAIPMCLFYEMSILIGRLMKR